VRWRIWYGDGSCYSDRDGSPFDAPALDVQVIVQVDPQTGRYNQSGSDYYVWDGETWRGVDIFGLFDYLIRPGARTVKFWRTIPNEQYRHINNLAEADPDFPPRSAYRPGERQ